MAALCSSGTQHRLQQRQGCSFWGRSQSKLAEETLAASTQHNFSVLSLKHSCFSIADSLILWAAVKSNSAQIFFRNSEENALPLFISDTAINIFLPVHLSLF